ncbi:hypothetical protein EN780_07875 [Mesorhizobium sp. M4B.F.Ca.ET.089.01.1.1]|uniref:hypothetical protein n=1 Tax=Mesorhizobium sp. M4B.F.Ca.ET.089.01.1.1 TaxID=2496662 RepID=UPI000FE2C5A5|nr:hypothetical protein [Mesorhizobium sp. M4B.F.Ca.ET.089.01.1.1]RWX68933.1 hypothetical protein EN780_07875 [Mesorhizobium sp. M4B.F.Ca.ET.089.01.1.1]
MATRTRAQLNSDADTYLPDQSTGDISPADVRNRVKDLADSAKLAEDLAPVASTGAYNDLTGKPTLGTAASKNTGTGAGQVPLLDSGGLLDTSILPAIAITDVYEVASQSAMLALTAQKGDVAIRTDLNKTFALATNSPSTLADWKELRTPTDIVLAVAGLTGTITASALKTALAIVAADITDASANGRSLITAASYAAMKTLLAVAAADITDASANGRSLITAANYAAMKTLLAVTAADITNASANGRSLITAADYAAMRTLLGIGTMAQRAVTISSSAPSGGADGDVWFQI